MNLFGLEQLFINLITFFAHFFNDSYGFSIIFMTLIIRLLLLPLFIKQEKQQMETQEKIKKIQPILAKLQAKLKKAKNNEEMLAIKMEMQNVYKEHNISVMSMGFLPAIIQMPFFFGFYSAIKNSVPISQHHFLWFSLGSKDVIISLIVGILYIILTLIMNKIQKASNNQENTTQQHNLAFILPAVMTIFAFNVTSGSCLYLASGALFMIVFKLITLLFKKSNPS